MKSLFKTHLSYVRDNNLIPCLHFNEHILYMNMDI